jgi:uncharacterized protein
MRQSPNITQFQPDAAMLTPRPIVRAQLFAALCIICAAPLAFAQSIASEPLRMPTHVSERTVSVSAQGHASAAPDRASISTGVQTEADTAREAMSRNTAAMSKLIDGLKALGIAGKDIQTTAIQINPRYTQPRDGKTPVVNGYTALNQVRIVVGDIKKIGEVLDSALTLGANQMGGIAFEASGAETLRDDARKQAMVNARRRAELYAAAAGVTLGQVLTISEDIGATNHGSPMLVHNRAKAYAVPIEAGTIDLAATVHVTWALK